MTYTNCRSAVLFTGLSILVLCNPAQAEPPPPNIFLHEPVLVYDVSGSTLAQTVQCTLTVYNNGHASIAEKIEGVGQEVDVSVAPVAANRLRFDLALAGAFTLGDNPDLATDVPLRTVTYFPRPGPRALANTFSYLQPTGPWFAVDAVIERFIDVYFPGKCDQF